MYQSHTSQLLRPPALPLAACNAAAPSNWYAVYTAPQHEKACQKNLVLRGIEAFLPTYAQERYWKNRQHVKVQFPLFPSYLFVRIDGRERARVLGTPGVLRVLGNSQGPQPIPDDAIELLRGEQFKDRLEPHPEMATGQRVRIRNGAMQGLEGVLTRKKNSLWFVLSIELINQRVMVEVQAQDIEGLSA